MDLSQHPEIQRIQAEVRASQSAQRQQAELDKLETQRVRAEQGRYLAAQYQEFLARYEEQREKMHETVGDVWKAVQAYSAVTRQNPPGFSENLFNEIHLPSLKPSARWSSGFSTTRQAVMAWFASAGKVWN